MNVAHFTECLSPNMTWGL